MSQAAGWLNAIPSDWQRKKLKYVASLKSGDSITSDDIAESGEYPVFGGNGIRGYASAYTHCGRHVLIGRQGALCGNINYATGCFWASEHAVVASINAEADVTWLGELLRSMNLNQYSQSAAQPGLAVDVIGNLEIPVPPLHEQRAIAGYLDRETVRLDELVAAKERVLDLLAEKRRGLITRAVTRGLDPSAPHRDSAVPWLGEIPVHWSITRLKRIAWLKSGEFITADSIGPDLEFPVFGGNGIRGYTSSFTHDGDHILVGRQGALCGNINYGTGRFWASEHAVVVNLHDGYQGRWLGELLEIMNLNQFSQSAAQPGLAVEVIANVLVPIPPFVEQRAIVDHIAADTAKLDAMRSATERTIALIKERRAALIAAAVTGQIDVGGGRYYTDDAASEKEPGRRQ